MEISNDVTRPISIRDQQRISSVDQTKGKGARNVKGRQAGDEVALSDEAQLLTKLGQAVDDSPDVREEKVAALRDAVKKQQYQISYSEIAKAMLASRNK